MERTALKSSVDSSSAAAATAAADRPGGVTVVKPAIHATSSHSAMQDQDVGVIDTRLDEMHALIQANGGGGIPITQQFSTDDLLYLVSMFEEDENMISSSNVI